MGNKYLEKIAKTLSEEEIDRAASGAAKRSWGSYHLGALGGPLAIATGTIGTHYANKHLHRATGHHGPIDWDSSHLLSTAAHGLGGTIVGGVGGGVAASLTGAGVGHVIDKVRARSAMKAGRSLPAKVREGLAVAGLLGGGGAGLLAGSYYGHKRAHKDHLKDLLDSKK